MRGVDEEYLPGFEGQLLNVRKDGDQINFTSMCSERFDTDDYEILAALVLQHIARSANVDAKAFYENVGPVLDAVVDSNMLKRHTTQ